MDELLPGREIDIDVAARVAAEPRAGNRCPWVMINMITSLDGATAVEGRSGGLGGPGDRAMFSALRAVADVVFVAAGTARAEDYGPPTVDARTSADRKARGQAPRPVLALVTRSLRLDPAARMFCDPDTRPLVYTVASAPASQREALAPVAELVDAGDDTVDLSWVMADLGSRGAGVVLAEGGPSLNGQMLAADLIDEVCWSIAPVAVSGESTRLAHGAATEPIGFALERLFRADQMLFARYVRTARG